MQSPTLVLKHRQVMYDVICASTQRRVCDVHDVYRLAGKRQHMEVHLDLISVQLRERGGRGGNSVSKYG